MKVKQIATGSVCPAYFGGPLKESSHGRVTLVLNAVGFGAVLLPLHCCWYPDWHTQAFTSLCYMLIKHASLPCAAKGGKHVCCCVPRGCFCGNSPSLATSCLLGGAAAGGEAGVGQWCLLRGGCCSLPTGKWFSSRCTPPSSLGEEFWDPRQHWLLEPRCGGLPLKALLLS